MTLRGRRFSLERLTAVARILVGVEFAIAVTVIVYAGFHDFTNVFNGSPPALPVRIEGRCEAAEAASSCRVSISELNAGRYRISTDAPAARMTLLLSPRSAVERARVLLVRLSQPNALRLVGHAGTDGAPVAAPVRLAGGGVRIAVPLESGPDPITTLSLAPEAAAAPVRLVLDEFGMFDRETGLLIDDRPLFRTIPPRSYHLTLVPRAIARLCAFTIVAAFIVPASILRRLNPVLLALVCFALCLIDLSALYSPYAGQDLRLFYVSGPLGEGPGANLNNGLWQGLHLLQGQGLTILPGVVPWERMPGYGLFCALAGALFGKRSMVDLALGVVLLQTLFYCFAVGVLAWAASLLWRPPVVWTLGLLMALLPKQLGLTQGDAIIAPIMMLIAASICVRLRAIRHRRQPPIALDLLTHLAFAIWFLTRPDVLPGWLVVSAFIHWRDRRRLLIPIVLVLSIGSLWGAYKFRYTHEFVLTTTSAGASLFCGLWEVPSRFALSCSDEAYFDWLGRHTVFRPQTQAANSFAVREVLRFWLTYPGHFVIMLYHKMLQCLGGDFWPGFPTQLQVSLFELVPRAAVALLALTVLALSVVVGYERDRTLLFAWPLFLDAPLFWVMFASLGRFYSAVGIGLLVATVPPLFDGAFYESMAGRPWRTASVVLSMGVVAMAAWPVHGWLLAADAFHYWTPFLDPAKSLLAGFK